MATLDTLRGKSLRLGTVSPIVMELPTPQGHSVDGKNLQVFANKALLDP
jgi:hypothetical protein